MSEIKVATRYAKSLIDLSLEQNAMEEIKSDMELFVNTLKASTELQAVLKNPIIPISKKNAITNLLFSNKVHKTSAAFLKIIIDKGRSEIIYSTAKEFLVLYNQFKKIYTAKIVSAQPLSHNQIQEVKSIVINEVKGEVILQTEIDESLIGGFVLTVGDKQFDASISKSLSKLKKTFASSVLANNI